MLYEVITLTLYNLGRAVEIEQVFFKRGKYQRYSQAQSQHYKCYYDSYNFV